MTTTTIDIGKTPTELADLLSLALSGTEVIIVEDNKPLARLVPVHHEKQRIGNLNPGSIAISDDFDDALPDEFWTGTE